MSDIQEENERLNNIIYELEKELDLNLQFKVIGVKRLKDKLNELKGDNKEWNTKGKFMCEIAKQYL